MVIWWASVPFMVLGLWFSVRYRLRMISPILIFTVMLTFAYSVFQGNVGTAYRQRAQLLVFYFIFVAVGYVLTKEKREERKRLELERQRGIAIQQAAIYKARPGSPVA
jgi:Ca2+/Na+ antiporter